MSNCSPRVLGYINISVEPGIFLTRAKLHFCTIEIFAGNTSKHYFLRVYALNRNYTHIFDTYFYLVLSITARVIVAPRGVYRRIYWMFDTSQTTFFLPSRNIDW